MEKTTVKKETSIDLIIDEVYKNYRSKSNDLDLPENLYNKLIDDLNKDAMFPIDNPNRMLSKEQFINKCKTDSEFSEKWGLKIEERELSLEERMVLCKEKWDYSWNRTINLEDIEWRMNNEWNVPTKQITLEYNNEKTYYYE